MGSFVLVNLPSIHGSSVYFENLKLCIIYSVGYCGNGEERPQIFPLLRNSKDLNSAFCGL